MEALKSVSQNIVKARDLAQTLPGPVCDFRKAIAIDSYQRTGKNDLHKGARLDSKILYAVKRWMSYDDVRIEFYAAKSSGEIRVRVITKRPIEKSCDMSLSRFVSCSPETI